MTVQNRETMLLETFVSLADTLVADYDVVAFLDSLVERCAVIFEATEVGIILADVEGRLGVIASTSERTRLIEVLQLAAEEGPCTEAFARGTVISADDPEDMHARWPDFASRCAELGFRAVHSVPLRLRNTTIGSLNLFRDRPGSLSAADAATAQALADIATIGILHERTLREADEVRAQLQHALDTRVLIEQAKGVVAHMRGVDMDTAFRLLRQRARSHQARLSDVAQGVIEGLITI